MGKRFNIRFPSEDPKAVVGALAEEKVHTRLMMMDGALPILVDEFLKSLGLNKIDEAPLRVALTRCTEKEHGPGEGYDVALARVLESFVKIWKKEPVVFGLRGIVYAECHGFAYDSLEEHQNLISGVLLVLSKSFEEGSSFIGSVMQALPVLNGYSGESLYLETFHWYLHALGELEGLNCRKYKISSRRAFSTPMIPCYLLHGVRGDYEKFSLASDRKRELGLSEGKFDFGKVMSEGWMLIKVMVENGFTEPEIGNALAFGVSHALDLIGDDGAVYSWDALLEILGSDRFEDLLHDTSRFHRTASAWHEAGRPVSFVEFIKLGGSTEAYEAHIAQQEELKRRSDDERLDREQAARIERERLETLNAPKGLKRGQRNAPETSHVEIDFSAMCAQLDVATHFSDVDQDTTRVILIHGLLREGKRLASMAALPERDEKKLWKQCREHLGQSVTKRMFNSILKALVAGHLVSASGGKYQLARKKPRWAEAYALLTQLQGLVSGHRS